MYFEKAKTFILAKLKSELRPEFSYHSFDHVIDVYSAAEKLAVSENIGPDEKKLLLTAALFHDAGFIVGPQDHEEESCRIAGKYLPNYGYNEADIATIAGMIIATRLPQQPTTLLEEIIADADLDYLGRDDFFLISDRLYQEFLSTGVVKDYDDWNKLQVRFFENHHYFTASAKRLRDKEKAKNLEAIKLRLLR